MSSLQKFHRRTNVGGGAPSPFTTLGSGNATVGFWLGDLATNRLVVAPSSTDVTRAWGSQGTVRSTTVTSYGLGNTNTLYGFGATAHPAAYYCKTLATGGYNTWYLPARDELTTCWSNHAATPFATANAFNQIVYWASTEFNDIYAWLQYFNGAFAGGNGYSGKNMGTYYVRAVRRSTI